MNKTLLVVLAATLALTLTGCGSGSQAQSSGDAASQTEETATETSGTAEETGPAAEDLLTIADVEGVMDTTGIKLIPYDPSTGAGGTLNFATADGVQVLLLTDASADLWDESKAATGMLLEEVTGVGDEAFIGPDASMAVEPYMITFRAGDRMFSLASFLDVNGGGTTYFTIDQLKELAGIVVSRL